MRNLKILFSYLGAYRRDAILGVFFVSAETALELFIPVIMANIIDAGTGTGVRPHVRPCGFGPGR